MSKSKLSAAPLPAPLTSNDVSHGFIETAPGVTIHYVEKGDGPAVILLHGFPESWYGYRHQIGPLAAAGYRVICLDQRGYGESSAPPNISDYSQENLTGDVITLMDALKIVKATVVGHDWGGGVAWNLALFYPDRFSGVVAINTPFNPVNPAVNPLEALKSNPAIFDYVLYFQNPSGVVEKELEADVECTFRLTFQGFNAPKGATALENTANVRQRGGLFNDLQDLPRSDFISQEELLYYVEQFKANGFRGPLNWYRNQEENWRWSIKKGASEKITIPALMVTSTHDYVLKPEFSLHMEKVIPHLKRLSVENSTHWTTSEQPEKLNQGLIKFLQEVNSS